MAAHDIVIFLGPSLPVDEARRLLPACYLGPARCGDVLRARRLRPWAMAVIDGLFDATPAVWHKEILVALEDGIEMYGASSMGALRAAELERFGMVGVGRIFEAYREGTYTDDDEVALLHGPADFGYRPLSDAMVNIRATVADAVDRRIIGAASGERVVRCAKATFYQNRSLAAAIDDAWRRDPDDQEATRLRRFVAAGGYVDRKRLDAIELLETLAARRQAPRIDPGRRDHRSRTSLVLKLDRDVMCEPFGSFDSTLPRAERAASAARTLEPLYPHLLRLAQLMSTVYALCGAGADDVSPQELERVYSRDDFGLGPAARSRRWSLANDLDERGRSAFVARLAVIRRALDEHRHRHGQAAAERRHTEYLLSWLRREGLYVRLRRSSRGRPGDAAVLRAAARAPGIEMALCRRISTLSAIADDALERVSIGATRSPQRLADEFRRARGLERREATLEWQRANNLDHQGFVELVMREARLDLLLNQPNLYAFGVLHPADPASWLLDALRLTARYGRLKRRAAERKPGRTAPP